MKTIKELIEQGYSFLKSNRKEHTEIPDISEMAPQLFEFLNEKGVTDSVAIGVHAGFLHASAWYEYRIENENLTNQKELDYIKTQYDIKCDEKRKSDNEIARLIKIIMDAGLTEKLEVD